MNSEEKKAAQAAIKKRWDLVKAKASASVAPTLSDGQDKTTAKELTKRFSDAQSGMRRIVALGLFAWEIKETKLKHGQWGAWLSAHCPKLTRIDQATNQPKPSTALSGYMDLTRGVLDNLGFTVEKYLAHISNSRLPGICQGGKYLLLPDKKLPAEVLPLKEKICSLVDGKTQRQLFLEFKQTDADGKPKVGRLQGQGGKAGEPDGPIEAIVAYHREYSVRHMGIVDHELNKLGLRCLHCDDDTLNAWLGTLQRHVRCLNTWLNAAPAKRDPKEIQTLWSSL
jgi:hypothetical protein